MGVLRVDTITGWQRLAVTAYGYGVALPAQAALLLARRTIRIEHTGAVPNDTPAITCAWHEHLPAIFITRFPAQVRTIWLNHPLWVMKPVHLVLGWAGVELALGSSGHGGRAALARVIDAVRDGAATFLNPDGPRGPAHVVKDGVLDLAIRTGRPVTALSFSYRGAARLPTWEKKWLPLPGGAITVHFSPPLIVTEETREWARQQLTEWLDGRR
jgi:hypothetical protein